MNISLSFEKCGNSSKRVLKDFCTVDMPIALDLVVIAKIKISAFPLSFLILEV
jgi:hypothetical protein